MNWISARDYRHQQWLVAAGMGAICLLSWVALLGMVGPSDRQTVPMPAPPAWDGSLLLAGVIMWSVMMVAMMLPTAAPMALGFTRIQHRLQPRGRAVGRTGLFLAGYLLAWTGFSLLAAVAQWALHAAGLMGSAMGAIDSRLAAGFLLAAGLFQWSGLKEACLTQCQSPLSFLLNQWRDGGSGALLMGLHHGAFCIGCCWLLMLLMFVGGVMNLLWMAAITLFVLAEKLIPGMRTMGRLTGIVLIGSGVMMLAWGPFW